MRAAGNGRLLAYKETGARKRAGLGKCESRDGGALSFFGRASHGVEMVEELSSAGLRPRNEGSSQGRNSGES